MVPEVLLVRGDRVESRHHIAYAIVDGDGTVVASSTDGEPVFIRSVVKPLICILIVASGAAERFGFTREEIALIAGSHSGEPVQVSMVVQILEKIGLKEEQLRCGAHPPFHEASALALSEAGVAPTALHNNCSASHAGVLALAVQRGYPIAGYGSLGHPAEAEILSACAAMFEVEPSSIVVAVDGCAMPTFGVPLAVAARFYARLAAPESLGRWGDAAHVVTGAMLEFPYLVAGTGRFDTTLMQAAHPSIVSKSGAEGVHALAWMDGRWGMCTKVIDGADRAVAPFVVEALRANGILNARQLETLSAFHTPPIFNNAHEIVGNLEPVRRRTADERQL